MYYDKHACTEKSPQIQIGDTVRVQKEHGSWEPAQVKQKTNNPRSYTVQTERGELRRNTRHLVKTNENPPIHEPTDMKPGSGTENEQDANPNLDQSRPQPETKHVTTRSGRLVKPPVRYIQNS